MRHQGCECAGVGLFAGDAANAHFACRNHFSQTRQGAVWAQIVIHHQWGPGGALPIVVHRRRVMDHQNVHMVGALAAQGVSERLVNLFHQPMPVSGHDLNLGGDEHLMAPSFEGAAQIFFGAATAIVG